jgi:hypothetical protein
MQEGSKILPTPTRPFFTNNHCTLVIVETGFYRDFGCDIKFEKNTEKYSPLLAALIRYWGQVEFIAFPIGHQGTTLTRALDKLTAAFSTVQPNVERSRDSKGAASPATDHNVITHDYTMFKLPLDSLTDLAQSRLIGIISRKRKRLLDDLPGGFRHHRASSDVSPTHHQATHQQGAATHTRRTLTTRAPESTTIT